MRKIVVALTAASLAVSMLAMAIPAAAAVSGYDSSYAGESAFVNLSPGQSNEFQVFFANTGTTTWTVGGASQVDLAACLDDKVTCNAQDATEATWNPGSWLSSTRYATSTQASVAPGSVATFKYTVTAPAGVAAGTYHFNGALVLHSSGADIHNEGYFQDATVGAGGGAATITSLSPASGTSNGGTTVTIAGSGFVCTPSFPTVNFGSNTAAVTSCGATQLTATSPAGAVGSTTVTVTNAGAAASNGLTYTYVDTTHPVFQSFVVSGNLETVTFSEPVCRDTAFNSADWSVRNVSAATTNTVTGDSIPMCDAARDNAVTTAILQLTTAVPNGAFVETTLNSNATCTTAGTQGCPLADNATVNASINDVAGNGTLAPQARQATAAPADTTPPTIASVSGAVGTSTVKVTFSEPVYCTGVTYGPEDFTLNDNNSATTDPTVTGASTACGSSPIGATTSFTLTLSANLPSSTTYVFTATPESGEITDAYGNNLANPSTFTFTTGAADFTPPTITDARMVNNALPSSDFVESGDSFSLTFSETMNGSTTGTIAIQDQDGTVATIQCSAVAGANQATCSWDSATTTVLTVTLTGTLSNSSGTTPGMQIPFNITATTGITDTSGNPPNILGSPDRLVDYE